MRQTQPLFLIARGGFWKLYNKIQTKRKMELQKWLDQKKAPSELQIKDVMPLPRSKAFGYNPTTQTHDPAARWPTEDQSAFPFVENAKVQLDSVTTLRRVTAKKPTKYT
eukprot:EG_transcript_32827